MIREEQIAKELVSAVSHTLNGNGPSSVRLQGPHGMQDGCVVFVFGGEVGIIIDEALERLYAHLGWRVLKK